MANGTAATFPSINRGMYPNINYELWMIMHRVIIYNKCTMLVWDVDNVEGMYVWLDIRKSLYIPFIFAMNLKLL